MGPNTDSGGWRVEAEPDSHLTQNITWLHVSTLHLPCLFFSSATEIRSIRCSSSLGQPGEEEEAGQRKPTFVSFLLLWPPKSTFHASILSARPLPVLSAAMWQLRHTAARLRLRLLVLCWLFQFEEGRVAAGWRVVNRTPVGGDQGHSGVLWVGFGIREGVRRAVAKVTIKQGVIQQLGSGPLFFQLRQSLGALFRPGLLLGGRAASVRRWHGAIGGRRCQRGRSCGDEAVLCAGAILEDGLQPGFVWLLDWRDGFDLQDNKEWFWIVDLLKNTFYKQCSILCGTLNSADSYCPLQNFSMAPGTINASQKSCWSKPSCIFCKAMEWTESNPNDLVLTWTIWLFSWSVSFSFSGSSSLPPLQTMASVSYSLRHKLCLSDRLARRTTFLWTQRFLIRRGVGGGKTNSLSKTSKQLLDIFNGRRVLFEM